MPAELLLSASGATVSLTPAQVKLMESIGRGNMPMAEVARDLGINPQTVQTQLSRICPKLEARHWFHAHRIFERARRKGNERRR